MPLRHRRPTRWRALALGVTGVALVVGTSACSTIDKAQSVAIVNGSPIYRSDVATATEQINRFVVKGQGQAYTEKQAVSTLVLSEFVIPYVTAKGSWKPDKAFTDQLAAVPGATSSTIELLKFNAITSGSSLTQGDVDGIIAEMKKADVQVDPRYGVFDPAQGGFSERGLNWIKPSATGAPEPAAP